MSFLLLGSLACGLFAGVIAGLFGVGGGILIVPVLLFLFHLDGINPAISMQLAVGTSLATIVITNISATWNHHLRNGVHWTSVQQYIPGILLGAWLGSQLAALISGKILIQMFGGFEILVGMKMIHASHAQTSQPLNCSEKLNPFIALAVGTISSMFGIGGGTLTVPALTLITGLPMPQAVGSASAIGLALALAGSLGHVQAGWHHPDLPTNALGFLLPSAFLGIIAGTLSTTPLGVRLAHSLNPVRLKRGFGVFLALVGLKLIWW
ncbi:MAG: sulfite exporter TauE/SafE family protein [Magnetococcus sp. YQC-5]